MKHLIALVAFASLAGVASAQDEEQRRAPPVEIPDFSNLDEYIYEPKSTLVFGIRYLSGAKVSFAGGTGRIVSQNSPGDPNASDITRIYQDGAVQPGSLRFVLDEEGKQVLEADGVTPKTERVPPAGFTDTWNYTSTSQLERPGFIAFRDFSADIMDTTTRSEDSKSTMGMDLAWHRDMPKFFGNKFTWALTVGMSVNDISADTSGGVRARINTTTDYYSYRTKEGLTLPEPPYSAPSFIQEADLDAEGVQKVDEAGNPMFKTTDTTVLLGDRPADRTNTSLINDTSVTNRWKVKGAYYTFRAGPTIWIPFTNRIRASISVGAALVYAGSTYTVTETLIPEIGPEVSETETAEDYKLLPGYYADASLQFDLTERAGFYAGAIYQSAGDFNQVVENSTTSYTTKIDLAKQSGVRAGMTIRF